MKCLGCEEDGPYGDLHSAYVCPSCLRFRKVVLVDERTPMWMTTALVGLASQASKGHFWNCMGRLLELHREVVKAQIEQINAEPQEDVS